MRKLIIIVGPTAVGKTDYSIDIALKHNSPIISCDSRQVYKEMTIGTAVPNALQLNTVKHYFIHTQSITQLYTAGQYEIDAINLIQSLFNKGHEVLVMVGGSGFYVNAVCNGLEYIPTTDLNLRNTLMERLLAEGLGALQTELKSLDPLAYNNMDINNTQRVVRALEVCLLTGKPFSSFKINSPKKRDFEIEKICIVRPRSVLYNRINQRVDIMMNDGLLQEAQTLLPYRHYTAMQTVGYKELFEYFDDSISLERAVELIKQHTRNYAKRQLTWWRADKDVKYLDFGNI